jgi:hypothetical protein
MDLAAHLGAGSLRELLARTTSRELALWRAKYRTDPFGEVREDLRMAMLCSLIANSFKAMSGKKGRGKWFEFEDFLLFKDPESAEDKRDKLDRELKAVFTAVSIQNEKATAKDKKITQVARAS